MKDNEYSVELLINGALIGPEKKRADGPIYAAQQMVSEYIKPKHGNTVEVFVGNEIRRNWHYVLIYDAENDKYRALRRHKVA